jgi:hypothetical protein
MEVALLARGSCQREMSVDLPPCGECGSPFLQGPETLCRVKTSPPVKSTVSIVIKRDGLLPSHATVHRDPIQTVNEPCRQDKTP